MTTPECSHNVLVIFVVLSAHNKSQNDVVGEIVFGFRPCPNDFVARGHAKYPMALGTNEVQLLELLQVPGFYFEIQEYMIFKYSCFLAIVA